MGPAPTRIGYLIDECDIICADCLDAALDRLPVSIDAAIYDDGDSSHDRCSMCEELLDPTVSDCYNQDCCECGHNRIIDDAKETINELMDAVFCDRSPIITQFGADRKTTGYNEPPTLYGHGFDPGSGLALIWWKDELLDGYDILARASDYLEDQR
jgi:hypothetical protein